MDLGHITMPYWNLLYLWPEEVLRWGRAFLPGNRLALFRAIVHLQIPPWGVSVFRWAI